MTKSRRLTTVCIKILKAAMPRCWHWAESSAKTPTLILTTPKAGSCGNIAALATYKWSRDVVSEPAWRLPIVLKRTKRKKKRIEWKNPLPLLHDGTSNLHFHCSAVRALFDTFDNLSVAFPLRYCLAPYQSSCSSYATVRAGWERR